MVSARRSAWSRHHCLRTGMSASCRRLQRMRFFSLGLCPISADMPDHVCNSSNLCLRPQSLDYSQHLTFTTVCTTLRQRRAAFITHKLAEEDSGSAIGPPQQKRPPWQRNPAAKGESSTRRPQNMISLSNNAALRPACQGVLR